MDNLNRQSYSESLKNTLSCYQLSSADSLSGPSGYPALAAQLWFKENNQSPPMPPRPPVIQIPLLIPNDTSTKRSETYLSGVKISCFIVGGEKRLCLPQILTTVLKDYSIQEINRTCAELHIYCSRCSPDQLEILKVLGILPFNTTQCGLITKTDAERLVAALGAEFHLNGKHDFHRENLKGIHVYHECFGRGDGIFYPDLYLSPDATCIACLDCRSTFSPARFVLHSHSILEKRTCHWGFDRDHWRNYLLIPRDIEESKYVELEKQLNQLKARFDPSADAYINNQLKRRLKTESSGFELNTKRPKGDRDAADYTPTPSANCFGVPFQLRSSAFKPWADSNLQALAELKAGQDAAAIMKAFVPLIQDRRLYPSLLQFAPPTVAPPHTSSEWTKTTQKSQDPPNVTLQPMDLQKKTVNPVIFTEKVHDNSRKQRLEGSPLRENKRLASKQVHETSIVKTEGASQGGSYPMPCRRISNDAARIPARRQEESPSKRPFLEPSRAGSHLPPKKDSWKSAPQDHHPLKRSRDQDYSEKVRRSREENRGMDPNRNEEENVALKSAAAAAMLELSSGVEDRKEVSPAKSSSRNSSQTQHHPTSERSPSKSPNSSYPKVSPFPHSNDHFKWSFSDSTFIISASGTEELKKFHQLLLESASDNIEVILKEVVKMKYYYEEKIDIQRRIQRDYQVELERLKSSKQRCLDEAADVRTQLRHDLDRVRDERHREMKEANEALILLGKNLADIKHHSNHEDGDSLQHKILDRLHKQVDDKENDVRNLEKQLLEERDRRVLAERRLEEAVEASRGRISLLMDGNFTSIMKNIAQNSVPPHGNSRSPPNRYSKSGSTSPNTQSPKDSGVHDV